MGCCSSTTSANPPAALNAKQQTERRDAETAEILRRVRFAKNQMSAQLRDEVMRASGNLREPDKGRLQDRWQTLIPVERLLLRGETALVKGSWLVQRAADGNLLPCRQDLQKLTPSAFWGSKELTVTSDEKHGPAAAFVDSSGRAVQVLAISYCWWSQIHPDPEGKQLRHLGQVLNAHIAHQGDCAVFIDWCSLYQAPRTDAEEEAYLSCLDQMGLWYTHPRVKIWRMLAVPDGVPEGVVTSERGWLAFEKACSDLIHDSLDVIDVATSVTSAFKPRLPPRDPPLTPLGMEDLLRTKKFTVAKDFSTLLALYQTVFFEVIASASVLSFANVGWDEKKAQTFAKVLPHCRFLMKLDLSCNKMGDEGVGAVAEGITHCKNLETLVLRGTGMGDEGAVSISESIGRTLLRELDVTDNRIGHIGFFQLKATLANLPREATLVGRNAG